MNNDLDADSKLRVRDDAASQLAIKPCRTRWPKRNNPSAAGACLRPSSLLVQLPVALHQIDQHQDDGDEKRNASGTPFHCFDIHMPNHSPQST